MLAFYTLKGKQQFEVIVSHPGFTQTQMSGQVSASKIVAMKLEKGALSCILSAVKKDIPSRSYFGPNSAPFNLWGYPHVLESSEDSKNIEYQDELWKISEERTSIKLS